MLNPSPVTSSSNLAPGSKGSRCSLSNYRFDRGGQEEEQPKEVIIALSVIKYYLLKSNLRICWFRINDILLLQIWHWKVKDRGDPGQITQLLSRCV